MNPTKVLLLLLIYKASLRLSVPVGRQSWRCVLYLQAVFFLLGPLEPVILWTGAQEKAEWERGGVGSLVPGVRSLCTGKESEAPNSAHARTVREDPNLSSNLSESVKMVSTTATDLGSGHLSKCGVCM